MTGRSIELEHGPGPRQLARPTKHNDQTSSNDTVFYDKELLSDLYSSREKDIKCTDITRTKRTRTKSETRGISEENSPTRATAVDNDKIVNLLKGNRRPLEVDAREFRVLKEKLLREQQHPVSNLKRETKKFKGDFVQDSRPKNVECELKFSDKINGRVHHTSTDEDVFWKDPGHVTHKEIVLDLPQTIHEDDIRLKPSRKSRRENFEIETKDYKHQPFLEADSGELKQKRHIDTKTSLEKHVSTKDTDGKQRESLPHHYTREEKEWLKEKLLQEFERQEKIQKDADCQSRELVTSKGSFLPAPDRARPLDSRGAGKENPINFMMSGSSVAGAGAGKPSHKSSGGPDKSSVSSAAAPACTCGAAAADPAAATSRYPLQTLQTGPSQAAAITQNQTPASSEQFNFSRKFRFILPNNNNFLHLFRKLVSFQIIETKIYF